MIGFIWRNWWRNRQRFILILVGALILSGGLSFLVGLTQTNKGTIVDELQKKWHASYDIVVRPPGTRSKTEDLSLLEPNYLSGISGGISIEQYEKIKKIPGISVAAPIAMIGYLNSDVVFKNLTITENGVYRLHFNTKTNIGPRIETDNSNFYFTNGGPWDPIGKGPEYGVGVFNNQLEAGTYMLIAGVDPKEEAKLVGLDKAVLPIDQSRYFDSKDKSSKSTFEETSITSLPILASVHNYVDETFNFTVEKLNLPFNNSKEASHTMETVKKNGGESYLNKINSLSSKTYTYNSQEAQSLFLKNITGVDPKTGKVLTNQPLTGGTGSQVQWLIDRPSPLNFEPLTSPFPQHWPFAYNVKTFSIKQPIFGMSDLFRKEILFSNDSKKWPKIDPTFIGLYDPTKLKLSKDPLTELPAETYQPASAQYVLDANEKPVNPPITVKPEDNPYALLTKPPTLLTTIDAASKIVGNKPISAIRIKVSGVNEMNKESEKKLEGIAKQIKDQTGLIVDITLGSSPQPTIIHVPKRGNDKELGWIQQPWVKLGSSFTLFTEANIGFTSILISVLIVAIVYVFASNLVSLYARKKEFAVLLAIGWQPKQLRKMLLSEALLIGVFVGVVTWSILGWIVILNNSPISLVMFLLSGIFGVIVYLMGSIIPGILTTRISPIESIQNGEVTNSGKRLIPTYNILSMALNQFIGKWRRGLLSILSISLPTGLLSFFLFVTLRLKGIMYTTWLGQYVSFQVGGKQYVALGIALSIAVLTTAEIMWQNVIERQPEIALLKALGWTNNKIRSLIWLEGAWSGLVAGVLGIAVSFCVIGITYKTFPLNNIGAFLILILVPIVTGIIGAIIPAENAVKLNPTEGMRGQLSNHHQIEKGFKKVLVLVAIILLLAFSSMLTRIVPHIIIPKGNLSHSHVKRVQGTKGAIKQPDSTSLGNESNSQISFDKSVGQTLNVGQTYTYKDDVTDVTITSSGLVPTPASIKSHHTKKGRELVSVKVTIKNIDKGKNDAPITYHSNSGSFSLMTNSQSLSPIDSNVVKSKNYTGFKLLSGGEATTIVTFSVPQNEMKSLGLYITLDQLPKATMFNLKEK